MHVFVDSTDSGIRYARGNNSLSGILRRGARKAATGITVAVVAAASLTSFADVRAPLIKQAQIVQQEAFARNSRVVEQRKGVTATNPVVFSIANPNHEFFITIDDGWVPSNAVLHMMKVRHIPITSFLIKNAMLEHPEFWKRFVSLGGSIGNHTASHPDIDRIKPEEVKYQIESCEDSIYKLLHVRPDIFRPPYGAWENKRDASLLKEEKMKYVVMWTGEVKVEKGGYTQKHFSMYEWHGGGIKLGDIILLHWEPGVDRALDFVLEEGVRAGLKPGSLTAYLK